MPQLAVLRAVQGLGAGGLFSLSVTIVGDVVGPRQRARYTGHLIAVYGVFGVLGPVVGGVLADAEQILGITGWRWVFLVNVPVGALALLVVAKVLRAPRRRPGRARVDWPGAAVLAVGVVPLLVVAEEGRGWGWLSGAALACYAIGGAGLAGFVLVERRMGDDALLPLRLFAAPVFRRACVAGLVVGFGMFGAITVLPLYLQVVGGAGPAEAGVLMLPLVAGIVATTAVSGKVIERTGRYRLWAVLGCGCMLVGFLWLSAMGTDTPFPTAAVCMAVFGIGIGGNLQSITLTVQDALPPADAGLATASTAFTRQLGGSIGASVVLSVLFGALPERITAALALAAPGLARTLADPAVLAEPANRQVAEALGAGSGAVGAVLEDSSFLGALHPDLARPFRDGFSAAMDVTFAVGALVMVLGLAAAFALPDTRLRTDPVPREQVR
jgi:MFS family permease